MVIREAEVGDRVVGFEPDGTVEHLATIANLPKTRMVRP